MADENGKILSVMGHIEDIHEEKMDEYLKENPEVQSFFIIIDLDDFKSINGRYASVWR